MLSEGQKWKYNIGVPQGSSLGPILWLLVINEVLDLRETENVLIQAYADDIIIMLRSTASYHFTGMSENILKHLEIITARRYNVEFFQSARQLRNTSNQNIRGNWQVRWSDSRKGTWTKKFYEKVDTKRICGDFYFNQVLAGHGVFGSFQGSMFGKPAECQCGQNIESLSHVILECELWRDLRSEWPKSWKNKDLKELVPIHEFRSQASAIVKALYETGSMDWS
ncbi:hypothetical protein AVEN_265932-1 [Araneus ventricosus]|uniref:Reverse transcriptase domain-containing protein n=1 Tax=Araneus ventricosus TaxID=182803 RepID=A0A4Y2HMF7_ARAVE|nr:hypothetical protein AVEN_265932-1 [Araneus ventricosus]